MPIYCIVLAEAALAVILYRVLGLRFAEPLLLVPPLWTLALLPCSWLLRRIGHSRVAGGGEALALVYSQGLAGWALLFPLAALSLPLADGLLARADAALGFDYATVYRLGVLIGLKPLGTIYNSFLYQPALVVALLFFIDDQRRMWRFVVASALALLITCLVFPFFPAAGSHVQYGLPHYSASVLPFGDVITGLRERGWHTVELKMLAGLVSFPSYHVAAAAIFVWAAWPVWWARWPLLLLNVAMTFAAIVIGEHYLVDIFGGLAVAVLATKLSRSDVCFDR